MQIIVLGSGTSHGVPMIGCRCPVCTSADPRNRRMRTSAAVRLARETLLIDTTPELRLQAVAAGIDRVDAVAITHSHADHVMGFDELRRFAQLQRRAIPVYAAPWTLPHLYRIYEYALTDDAYPMFGIPIVDWRTLTGPVDMDGHRLTPVTLTHGVLPSTGLRIDSPDGTSLAWCPDCRAIPPQSMDALRGLDLLFLDGLRHRPHPTHFTVAEAVETIRRLAPRQAYLIHMTHDLDHAPTEAALPQFDEVPGGIRLAYDGLSIELGR
ncbi:MAG TPA: MBL fold metallo-hydrolase [Phycisphaerae bacterium]|nr:MBL fold metallo-hydrolase [Phycisphaerae bacterium]